MAIQLMEVNVTVSKVVLGAWVGGAWAIAAEAGHPPVSGAS